MHLFQKTSCCAVILALLVPSTAGASEETIGPAGINSAGLALPNGTPLTGDGIGIGQVEPSRPGDLKNPDGTPFDTFISLTNPSVNPEGVFFARYDNPAIPGISNGLPNSDWVTFNAIINGPMEADIENRIHAVEVAGVMISTDTQPPGTPKATGVSTGAKLYSIGHDANSNREGSASLMSQYIAEQNGGDIRAINMSFSIDINPSNVLDGNSPFTQFVDWSAAKHNTLYVSGGNQLKANGTPITSSLPTDNFNGITVGRSAKNGGVYRNVSTRNYYGNDAVGDRTSIDILAPGDDILVATTTTANQTRSGTSLAAPHVTGTVALLQEYGDERILNSGTPAQWNPNARRHEVMKAVLMNSADKLEDTGDGKLLGMTRTVLDTNGNDWLHSSNPAATDTTIPLHPEFGAGHLNAKRALQQFIPGESDPGNVPTIGWDFETTGGVNTETRYEISTPLQADNYISITLAWDRLVELDNDQGTTNVYDIGDTFETYPPGSLEEQVNDLGIYLVERGEDFTTALAGAFSDGFVEGGGGYNLEHLFYEVPTTGLYDIVIPHFVTTLGTPLPSQDYALAW